MNMSEEEILGIFPAFWNKGVFSSEPYDLVFTTNRLMLAKRGRFSSLAPKYIIFYASARDKLKMKEVSPELMLKADPRNFAVPYSDITVVESKGRFFNVYVGDVDKPKYKFERTGNSPAYRHDEDFMKLIQMVLPDKV